MTCVSVYPFYRKLGFRPGRPDLLRIVLREERKIATMPGYRTPVRTLRKLATGHLFLELPGTTQEIWDRFRREAGLPVPDGSAPSGLTDDGALAALVCVAAPSSRRRRSNSATKISSQTQPFDSTHLLALRVSMSKFALYDWA
jgi:hypothetical protein